MVSQLLGVPLCLHHHPEGILKVDQMVEEEIVFFGQVDRLVTVGLAALSLRPLVDFPWSVSVPDGPMPISDFEVVLEPFPKTPLDRLILHNHLLVPLAGNQFLNRKERGLLLRPFHFDKTATGDGHHHLAETEGDCAISTIFRFGLHVSIDIEARGILKVPIWGDAETQDVPVSAGCDEEVAFLSSGQQIYLFEESVCQGVHFEGGVG